MKEQLVKLIHPAFFVLLGLSQHRLYSLFERKVIAAEEYSKRCTEVTCALNDLQRDYILLKEKNDLLESSSQQTINNEATVTFLQNYGTLCIIGGVCVIGVLIIFYMGGNPPSGGGGSSTTNINEISKNVSEAAVDGINFASGGLNHAERFVIDRYGTKITFNGPGCNLEGLMVTPLGRARSLWIDDIAHIHYDYSVFVETGLVSDAHFLRYGEIYTGIC